MPDRGFDESLSNRLGLLLAQLRVCAGQIRDTASEALQIGRQLPRAACDDYECTTIDNSRAPSAVEARKQVFDAVREFVQQREFVGDEYRELVGDIASVHKVSEPKLLAPITRAARGTLMDDWLTHAREIISAIRDAECMLRPEIPATSNASDRSQTPRQVLIATCSAVAVELARVRDELTQGLDPLTGAPVVRVGIRKIVELAKQHEFRSELSPLQELLVIDDKVVKYQRELDDWARMNEENRKKNPFPPEQPAFPGLYEAVVAAYGSVAAVHEECCGSNDQHTTPEPSEKTPRDCNRAEAAPEKRCAVERGSMHTEFIVDGRAVKLGRAIAPVIGRMIDAFPSLNKWDDLAGKSGTDLRSLTHLCTKPEWKKIILRPSGGHKGYGLASVAQAAEAQ